MPNGREEYRTPSVVFWSAAGVLFPAINRDVGPETGEPEPGDARRPCGRCSTPFGSQRATVVRETQGRLQGVTGLAE